MGRCSATTDDDADPANFPGNAELCDGRDNDCNGLADVGGFAGTEVDDDGDGLAECEGDCNDADATILPGAAELCDGRDNDCSGVADDGAPGLEAWPDLDGDSYGDASSSPVSMCPVPADHVLNADDCDDTDPAVSPDGIELPNNPIDEDCDGIAQLETADTGGIDTAPPPDTAAPSPTADTGIPSGPTGSTGDTGDADTDTDTDSDTDTDTDTDSDVDTDPDTDLRDPFDPAYTGGACGCSGTPVPLLWLGLPTLLLLRRNNRHRSGPQPRAH